MPTFTEQYARTVPLPADGQQLLYDDKVRGLGLRLTKTVRAWIVEIHKDGRSTRTTIGRVGEMSLADARRTTMEARLHGITSSGPRKGQPSSVTALWDFLRHEDEHRLRDRTKALYGGYWSNHIEPALGKKTLSAVTPSDISTMLAKIPGAAHANRIHELVKRMFGYAVDHRWVSDNPAKAWKRRHETPRQSYLDAGSVKALFAALPENEVGDALRFAALTGARIGEVLGMRRSDLRDNGEIWSKPASATKQRRDHVVPLSEAASAIFARQEERGPFVFNRADGTAVKNARRTWLWALKRSGLKNVRIHDLRHSLASAMINSGASLALVGQALGHSTPATTSRYAHVANSALKEALDKATASNVVPLRKRA